MSKHVYCPLCGQRLMKGEEGSNVQLKCARCEKLLHAQITKNGVLVELDDASQTMRTSGKTN